MTVYKTAREEILKDWQANLRILHLSMNFL